MTENPISSDQRKAKAKQNLQMLGRKGLLNRAGMPSQQNKAKRFKAPRVIDNKDGTYKYDPRDVIKNPVTGRIIQSNGSVGETLGAGNSGVTSGNKTGDFLRYKHKVNVDRQSRYSEKTKTTNRSTPRHRKRAGTHSPRPAEMMAENVRFIIGFRRKLKIFEWWSQYSNSTLLQSHILMLNMIDKFLFANCKDLGSIIKEDEIFKGASYGRFRKGEGAKHLPKLEHQMVQRAKNILILSKRAQDIKGA